MGLNTYPYSPFPASTEQLHKGDNEQIQAEIDQLKSDLTDLSEEVNGDATTYPYAYVITIEDAVPSNLAGCNVKIEPVQSGSGDPSPENVRPITGHTEVDVQRDGVNLCDKGEGNVYNGGKLIPVSAGDKIYCYGEWISDNKSFYGAIFSTPTETSKGNKIAILDDFYTGVSKEMTISTNGYFGVCFDTSVESYTVSKMMISKTPITSATDYEPFKGKTYTIALGDTVYGGTVRIDSNGNTVMDVDRAMLDLSTISNWSVLGDGRLTSNKLQNVIKAPEQTEVNVLCETYKPCSSQSLADDSTLVGIGINSGKLIVVRTPDGNAPQGGKLCYVLNTPTTIQLTPTQIQLLKCQNTLTASTGQISVTVNGVSGAIGSVQTQANATDAALAELAEQLPDAPTTDGAYVLTVTVDGGTPTYSWESAE